MLRVRSTDGVEIAYETAGQGPPDLLFMHGWAGSGAYFTDTIAALDLARARAITLDLRGHGASDRSEGGFTLEQLDADVLAVADATAAGRLVLVGYSMSGKFAQHLTGAHPERVLGQVLVGGAPATALPLPQELLEDWYARAGSEERMLELIDGYLTGPVAADARARFGRDAALVPLVALRGTMDAVCTMSFADALGDVPTLVVGGARDELFTPDALRAGVAGPIGARLALLDCGHEIPLERPRELAALIEAFLAGLG